MRIIDKAPSRVSRRSFLASSGAVAIVVSGGAIFCPAESWALETKNLKPETMRTVVKMARDIYPHDRLADRHYALAVKTYDAKAGSDAALKATIEDGVAKLDQLARDAHGAAYADVGWEAQRVALLHQIEGDAFFQKIRGDLITGLYNNEEVWPVFGYQGESASKGGYIERGFNDIEWL